MGYKPIGDYGIIGNMLSCALVGKDGAIDWCCLPRFDSPSVFAAILDDEKGGNFIIKPRQRFESLQVYVTDTNVLQTTFQTDTGAVTVTDFMPCYPDARGKMVKLSEIHRLVECHGGEVPMEVSLAPRLNYARGRTSLSPSQRGVTAKNGDESLSLTSSVPLTIDQDRATGQFTLRQGETAAFILWYGWHEPRAIATCNSVSKRDRTLHYWKEQADGCIFTGKVNYTIKKRST